MLESITAVLPPPLRSALTRLPAQTAALVEEVRIREGRPLEIYLAEDSSFVTPTGVLTSSAEAAYRPTRDDCRILLDLLTEHSVYTREEELKKGYLAMAGGHRVGLAGRAVVEQGKVKLLRDIAGFNLRIAREWKGAAEAILPYLLEEGGAGVHSTLLLSPPQQGKTTVIRDLARLLSSGGGPAGVSRRLAPLKVAVVDERSEIAACVRGVPTFDVGPRTDVLDGCPKAEGMMMMIRSLSPHVLIADEIGRPEDAEAVLEAAHAGIRVVLTAHAGSLEDAKRRPVLRRLLEDGAFARTLLLRRTRGAPTAAAIYGRDGRRLDPAGAASPAGMSGAAGGGGARC
ncbi:stage III sporulation protein AA [Paenibacillus sp. J31TS4]|uniref:stage III sporulation protein AA n=1 Tax=Paenibacillus sp. J31TS4 TaxID=2807195 RepID=UPI001B0C0FD3|nr:stage III sporulation protein AA [Paenibacillus sp. J31TS4]GIP37617.1 stage III sporulation protein AA [Paenibacillus sp. J31TS4]